MAYRKTNPYLSLVNSYLIDSPQPSSINYWYNLGSLLGLCLVIQIASGIFLAMHYSSNIELAFNSVEHIMRDVNAGWLIRYIHANGASFFFVCLYLHIAKALYYGSYKAPRTLVWTIGVIIFILTIATAFMGYANNSPKSIYNNKNSQEGDFYPQQAGNKNYSSSFMIINNIQRKGVYNRLLNKNNIYKANILNQKRDISYYVNPKQDNTKPEDILNKLGIKVKDYWVNLHDNNLRSKMIKHLKNKGGIYIIINKISHNYYIGSADINNIYRRFTNHMLNFHGSKLVKKAVLKDGLNNFIFAILEYYPNNDNNLITEPLQNRKYLYELETMYLISLMPKYNILTEAGTSIGYKHTDETIEYLKSLFTNERRLLLSKLQSERKGQWSISSKNKFPPEGGIYKPAMRVHKLREIGLNRSKEYLTNEGRLKISTVNSIKVYIYDLNNNYICEFNNIKTTSHYLCCSTKTIQRSLKLGWIYIPNIFTIYLNNDYIKNNNDFIISIKDKDLLYYKNTKNKLTRIKSGLYNLDWNTKYIIKITESLS